MFACQIIIEGKEEKSYYRMEVTKELIREILKDILKELSKELLK
jgi:hypothetical protein